MYRTLFVLALLGSGFLAQDAMAQQACTPKERANILQKATSKNKTVRVICNLTLGKGDQITKQVRLVGRSANGVQIRCVGGGVIGSRSSNSPHYKGDIIQIKSVKPEGKPWRRPENVLIKGCKINGGIRVSGLGVNGQSDKVKQSSRRKDHSRIARNAAPTKVTLSNLTIHGQGRVPVYFSPGVTHSKLINSKITGRSVSSGVYLDAESAHNTISGNVFAVATPREILSIDGSAHNTIRNNQFYGSDLGGVYVYRNCGEGGAARHQKPRYNTISGNRFYYTGGQGTRPTVWISFKNLLRVVFNCPLDRGIPYGSGANDGNFADNNTITNNTFVGSPTASVIRNDGHNNKIGGNKRVAK